jgi:HAD superfamily hydrolase (TIGR01509 family)
MRPKGILIDYGGTLVEEVGFDARAGNEALLRLAAYRPPDLTIDHLLERALTVAESVAKLRGESGIEIPWPALSRLIHDFLGVRFDVSMPELELAFWKAAVTTSAMPGALQALEEFRRREIPTAVVSNCSFGSDIIRYELGKHGLAAHFRFIMVSAEYVVRKPNVLLFATAAARLGLDPQDIWFIGDRLDTDVAGARAAHMKPVWLRGRETGEPKGVHLAADSWADIARQLG